MQGGQKSFHRERLGQKVADAEFRGTGVMVGREAAGGDDPHVGIHFPQGPDRCRAVHYGHGHIGDYRGDLVAVAAVD